MMTKLAIEGGKKVWTKGFPVWPQFDRKTDKKVLDILHSGKVNYWTGHVGMDFENAWAKWLGVKNAVAVSNGKAALHVALAALGIGSDDEVILLCAGLRGSNRFEFEGGIPNAIPELAPALKRLKVAGLRGMPSVAKAKEDCEVAKEIHAAITKRTKAIVVVHLCGMVADMDPVMKIAKRHKLYVIEDCSQCIGGVYKGKKAGTIGTVGCFSFSSSSHFTTGGEGGMVCCNDDDLAWEVRSVRDHGYDVKAKLDLLQMEGHQLYVHRRVGYNFRMTEIQAAIGLGELKRFDTWNLPQRRKLGKALVKGLSGHPLVKYAPVDTKDRQNSFCFAPFVLDTSKLKCTMEEFVAAVQAEGVRAGSVSWFETHKEGTDATIFFWTHPTYTLAHIKADVDAFKKVAAAMMSA